MYRALADARALQWKKQEWVYNRAEPFGPLTDEQKKCFDREHRESLLKKQKEIELALKSLDEATKGEK